MEVGRCEVDCDVLLQVYTRHRLDQSSLQVLVLNDSIKQFSGSNLEVVSRHFGHATI